MHESKNQIFMSLQIKFHESTNQILVYNCEPTIQWCTNPVSLLKGFLCYIFTPVSKTKKNAGAAKSAPRQRMKKEDALEEVLCDLCVTAGKPPKVYTRRSLTAHVKNWHDAGTYLCVTCGSSFALFGQLRNHNNSHHSFQANHPKPCPHCGKLVKCVKRHVKDVHGEKEECVCPQCARVGRLVSCSLLNVTFIAGVLRNGPAACAREAHAR